MIEPAYTYRATVTGIYDADTITVDVDLGMHVNLAGEKMRLFGIDAPEVRGAERPDGIAARDYLREILQGQSVVIQTFKDSKGKYGRWLCRVWLNGVDLNRHLVEMGYAEEYEY